MCVCVLIVKVTWDNGRNDRHDGFPTLLVRSGVGGRGRATIPILNFTTHRYTETSGEKGVTDFTSSVLEVNAFESDVF